MIASAICHHMPKSGLCSVLYLQDAGA